MNKVSVGRPTSAVHCKTREQEAPAKLFGSTVKAREGWGPEHQVHLHRYITPLTIDLAGGRDATHCRTHIHAAPGRK